MDSNNTYGWVWLVIIVGGIMFWLGSHYDLQQGATSPTNTLFPTAEDIPTFTATVAPTRNEPACESYGECMNMLHDEAMQDLANIRATENQSMYEIHLTDMASFAKETADVYATLDAKAREALHWRATEVAHDYATVEAYTYWKSQYEQGLYLVGGYDAYPEFCHPAIKGNVSYDTGEKIYHIPSQEFYEATEIDPAYGERWFCSEEQALDAGWRRSYK